MEIEPLIKEPTTLTFVTTEKCSSACSSCCFQCSPKRSKRLTKEQMVGYMEQVKRDFPTVISLVLTTYILRVETFKQNLFAGGHHHITQKR